MVLAGMVHHEIHAQSDSLLVGLVRKGPKVLDGAQLRLDGPEIADGVAPVAAALGAFHQRHQLQVVDPAVAQVGKLLPDALQGAREGIRIHQHPHQAVALVPVRVLLPGPVDPPEALRPLFPGAVEHIDKGVICFLIVVIQLAVQPSELLLMTAEAGGEFGLPMRLQSFFLLSQISGPERPGCLIWSLFRFIITSDPALRNHGSVPLYRSRLYFLQFYKKKL